MPDYLGFQYRVILDLYKILLHDVVIFGLEHDFLFKSASTYCESETSVFKFAAPVFSSGKFRSSMQ